MTAAALALLTPMAGMSPGAAAEPAGDEVAGVYLQLMPDGTYSNPGFGGAVQALLAYGAIYEATGAVEHRDTFEALLDYVLDQRPGYMSASFGNEILDSPALQAYPRLMANLAAYVEDQLVGLESDPGAFLSTGTVRNLNGNAELLVRYAEHLEREGLRGGERAALAHQVSRIDAAALAMLDRLVDLQYTREEATELLGNERWTGGFPNTVVGEDGSMGSMDVSGWSPAMLGLDQYTSTRALAHGFGRFHKAEYGRAAAAGSRLILGRGSVEPELVYAGSPAGFPLDGAEFHVGEETGEHLYLTTYGWSPNGIGQMGTTLEALVENDVTVPRSTAWAEQAWKGTPPESVLDSESYHAGLLEKIDYAHDFVEVTQLPVAEDFPWIDLPRTSYPGVGDDDLRRGGWYDGSGRGTMSTTYSQIMITGYVASGGRDVETLDRAAQWWDSMIVWE